MITLEQIEQWLAAREDEHVEFKEARNSCSFDELTRYCAAIANEGGGHVVLGITPKLPRRVVGSQAFLDLPGAVQGLLQKVHLRIEADEVPHPDGRVVVFTIPPRPIGTPLEVGGTYWMRAGESLTGMTHDRLKRILDEAVPDFSAEVCPRATFADLDPTAIETFRSLWRRKSGNAALDGLPQVQLLEDAGLLAGGAVTYAALVLLGTQKALGRLLAQAEVVFEYRSNEEPGPANQRVEFRQGFLLFFDELWGLINLRNDQQHFSDGLIMRYVPTFNEDACREAILNAVAHRDYRSGASVFVRQYPRRLVVESPGGFPPGITEENLLYRQNPRNRLLATSLARCGHVERAGQGADRMFRLSVIEGKPLPDFTHTDEHGVFLTLHGTVKDGQFVKFLEKATAGTGVAFGLNELLVLAHVHDCERLPERLGHALARLLDLGVVERVARNRLVLSSRYYRFVGRPGEYTRRRGLDRQTNKELLLKHVRECGPEGAPMGELQQVLPSKSRAEIKRLLAELREEGRVTIKGRTRGARWLIPIGSKPDGHP